MGCSRPRERGLPGEGGMGRFYPDVRSDRPPDSDPCLRLVPRHYGREAVVRGRALHQRPIDSPEKAVRAAIILEGKAGA